MNSKLKKALHDPFVGCLVVLADVALWVVIVLWITKG